MALKLKGSTSGFVGLDAPATAGNNTLILPENSGSAFQLFANDITAGVTTFTSVSVNRNGDLTVPGTISIGGTLTYEDVTSVDSVGIVTARGLSIFGNTTGLNATGVSTFTGNVSMGGGNLILGDSGGSSDDRIQIGASQDLSLYHNGSSSYIDNTGGSLFIKSSNQVYIQDDQGRKQITCVDGAAVELYHAGVDSVRLQTTTTGVSVPTLNVTGISTFTGNVFMPDNAEIRFGASGDLQLFHHSSTGEGRIYNSNAAGINIITDLINIKNNANNETMFKATNGGSVELYNNGTKTFETLASGNRSNITGSNTFIVGSSNAGGAYLVLDGDSNGDGSGGDYAYLEHSTSGHLNLVATNPADDAVMHFYTGDGARRMTLSSARALLSIGTTSDECPAWSTDRAGIKMLSNQPVLYMVDSQDTSGDDGYLGRAGATTYLGSKGGSVILQTSPSGSGTTARFTIDTVGAVTHASGNTGAHTQFYSYAGSVNGETTFRIGNTNSGSSANIRLLLSTYANQGADPYVKFDSGGTNFVVGQRWAGTTSNALVLGRGEDPSSMDAQLFMDGTGDVKIGSNGLSVSGSSGFYINASGNASSSTDNGYMDHRRRVGSGNAVAVHRGTQGQLQIHGDGDCENTNNNYSGISDVSLKENIVDASSQWNDIKAVKVRKFNFKSETGYSTDTHIGVVAQELESVSPNLVKEVRKDPDPKATDTSTIKSVKYSVLYMKSVKALQEAMARIETLETEVAALKGS